MTSLCLNSNYRV